MRWSILTALATAFVAAPSVAASAPVVAVQDDRLQIAEPAETGARAALIRATGARWTRLDVL